MKTIKNHNQFIKLPNISKCIVLLAAMTWGIKAYNQTPQGGIVGGSGVSATGQYSSAIGFQTIASGDISFAGGMQSQAQGEATFSFGVSALAKNNYSVALGWGASALSNSCVAIGQSVIAGTENNLAQYAVGIGNLVQATGANSMALGQYVKASGTNSMAIGMGYSATQYMTNSMPKSVAIATGSTIPTMYISASPNATGTGKVGIGNTTPLEKLHVSGKVKADALVLPDGEISSVANLEKWKADGSKLYYKSGNVGIGTDNPMALLSMGSSLANTKLALYDNGSSMYGMGIQSYQFLFHLGNPAARFSFYSQAGGNELLTIHGNGNVGIGTVETFDYKLAVNGTIGCKEVNIETTNNWPQIPDYVFDKTYNLPTLEEVETFIQTNHHLPEIPSAKEFEENGMNLLEMNILLLKKVEELTLYSIQQNRKIENLQNEIESLKKQ